MPSKHTSTSGPGHGGWTANAVPFPRSAELCHKITEKTQTAGSSIRELQPVEPSETWLPGYPRVPLRQDDILDCIRKELSTPKLDAMFPYLWLVASPSSDHVSPLTEQIVRGREIVVSENPELHLVWANSRVWIKPIPDFLLSYDFWSVCLSNSSPTTTPMSSLALDPARRACLGFLRTYYYLIQHRSDFVLAQQHQLIPHGVDFPRLMTFLTPFGTTVADSAVSLRYNYGQLRLTRLNKWAPLALRRWYFHKVQWQYADVFAQFYAPVLLVFGFFSIILAAMQVGTQARPAWEAFASVSAWFAVTSLLVVVGIGVVMAVLLVFMLLRELVYALKIKLH
ncbi:hypothetical protein HJFPF1_11139 [Paramyrothecium foliicola]|nr:hypothetical protein HJFPF1_11139 [Paramyrothecium foliicola]